LSPLRPTISSHRLSSVSDDDDDDLPLDPYRVIGFAYKNSQRLHGDLYIIKKRLGELEAIIEPIHTHPHSDLQRYLDKSLDGKIEVESYYLGVYNNQDYHIVIVAEHWDQGWMRLIPRKQFKYARMSAASPNWGRVLFKKLKMYLN
jgi:hypothetical protein